MDDRIDQYIAGLPEAWQREIMTRLRAIIHQADPGIEETIKWGSPFFVHDGLVCGMFSAKNWVHLGIYNAALVADKQGLFEETDNKGARSIKFLQNKKIPSEELIAILEQVVANNEAGKKVDFNIPKPGEKTFDVPHEYKMILQEAGKWDEYQNRPYYQQKGWVQWIEEARQPDTRVKRVAAMLKELGDGTYMPPKRDRT
jgi:hypothetical protein